MEIFFWYYIAVGQPTHKTPNRKEIKKMKNRYVVSVVAGYDCISNTYNYKHYFFDSVLLATRFANATEGATKVMDLANLPF